MFIQCLNTTFSLGVQTNLSRGLGVHVLTLERTPWKQGAVPSVGGDDGGDKGGEAAKMATVPAKAATVAGVARCGAASVKKLH